MLLIVKNGKQFKYSFIQAKSLKQKENFEKYNKEHKSFKANAIQDNLMRGINKTVYMMGSTPRKDLFLPNHKSITNYLIFYRKVKAKKLVYEADLSSVQGNTVFATMESELHCKAYIDQAITLHNISKKTHVIGDDAYFSRGFNNILKNIKNFNVGELDTNGFLASIKEFLPRRIIDALNGDCFVPDDEYDSQIEEGYPAIMVDISKDRNFRIY